MFLCLAWFIVRSDEIKPIKLRFIDFIMDCGKARDQLERSGRARGAALCGAARFHYDRGATRQGAAPLWPPSPIASCDVQHEPLLFSVPFKLGTVMSRAGLSHRTYEHLFSTPGQSSPVIVSFYSYSSSSITFNHQRISCSCSYNLCSLSHSLKPYNQELGHFKM